MDKLINQEAFFGNSFSYVWPLHCWCLGHTRLKIIVSLKDDPHLNSIEMEFEIIVQVKRAQDR